MGLPGFSPVLVQHLSSFTHILNSPAHLATFFLSSFIYCISSSACLKSDSSPVLSYLQTNSSYPASLNAGLFADFLPIFPLSLASKQFSNPIHFSFTVSPVSTPSFLFLWTTPSVHVHVQRGAYVNQCYSLQASLLSLFSPFHLPDYHQINLCQILFRSCHAPVKNFLKIKTPTKSSSDSFFWSSGGL